MTLTALYIVFIIISSLTICQPISYFWDKSQNGHCGNQVALYLAGGIFNLILDVTVVILPMPMLWGLQMAKKKKAALTGAFGLGAGYVQSHQFQPSVCKSSHCNTFHLTKQNLYYHNPSHRFSKQHRPAKSYLQHCTSGAFHPPGADAWHPQCLSPSYSACNKEAIEESKNNFCGAFPES